MIEAEALIDPEVVPPAPSPRRRRLAVLAGLTALAVVAGGIALAGGGRPPEPRLALMAGNGAGFGAESMTARDGSPEPAVTPALGTATDSKAALYPSGGWGMKFEVEGQLPDLPDHAAAWRVNGPALDQAAVARIAGALGLTGVPIERDGLWSLENGDVTLSVNWDPTGRRGPGSISLYRNRFDGQDTAAVSGPKISPVEAEQRVRDLLDRMGAPEASWTVATTETEIGVGWACAAPAPAPAMSPEELTKLEADKLRQVGQPGPAATSSSPGSANSSSAAVVGPTPADIPTDVPSPAAKPAPDGTVVSCPPPPPPVKGFTVALSPVLDGRRADFPVWNVTLRSDGRVEGVYGSWVTFAKGDSYKLRGVDAALKNLQSPPVAYATDLPARAATEPVPAAGMPEIAPVDPPAPQVVKVTGVELGLTQTSVFDSGQIRMVLVPSYRFTGRFDNGSAWETSVIALHPDAIAPPPELPVTEIKPEQSRTSTAPPGRPSRG